MAAPRGEIIATTFVLNIGEEVAAANAAFIVRAVNSHEALVEALETAEIMALNLRAEILRGAKVEGPMVAENLWLHAMKLRAALKLAKEGQQ